LDESFGIDNVVISSDARPATSVVPEPSTLALGAVGLGLLVSRLRR
jgi:MYXO-CTERM domain-containing protein